MSDKEPAIKDRRRFPRVMAPIFYRTPRFLSAKRRVSNISAGGVRIYSDERLKVGKRLEIEFFLPNGLSITAIARVVWIDELPPNSDSLYDVGLEFINLPPHATKELEAVLKNTSKK